MTDDQCGPAVDDGVGVPVPAAGEVWTVGAVILDPAEGLRPEARSGPAALP